MSSATAAPLSPGQPNRSGTSQPNVATPTKQPTNGTPSSSYPTPSTYNYSQQPAHHYPQPPTGYPSTYGRAGGPQPSYPQPGQSQAQPYNSYPAYPQPGGQYNRPGQASYPAAGPSRPGPNGLSNLLHPDGAARSPDSTPLSLPAIRPTSPTHHNLNSASSRAAPPNVKSEPSSAPERAPSPPMPLDPALAEPEPDLPVDLPPPGAAPPQPKKRPFDDLLGVTASLSASEGQLDRPSPADRREAQGQGSQGPGVVDDADALAFIVKKAVQMTNKAKLSAEADDGEDDGQDKGTGPAKKFPCPHQLCGRKFARSWNLQAHLKSHLGIRDFSCPECGKLFSRKHDCTRHCIAIHLYNKDGTKPTAAEAASLAAAANGAGPAMQHQAGPAQAQAQQVPVQVQHHQLPVDPNADLAVPAPPQ